MSMSKEELERLKGLCDAATDGPWVQMDAENNGTLGIEWVSQPHKGPEWYDEIAICGELTRCTMRHRYVSEDYQRKANAAFIAASRTAVPALIAEVERLRKRNAWLLDGYREMSRWGPAEAADRTQRYALDTLSGRIISHPQETPDAE